MRKLNGHDVFRALRIVNELGVEDVMKEYATVAQKKGFDVRQLGFGLIFRTIGKFGSEKAEALWWEFISAPMEMTPEEAASLDPLDLLQNKLPELEKTIGFDGYKAFFKSLAGLMK